MQAPMVREQSQYSCGTPDRAYAQGACKRTLLLLAYAD